jgi:hypothetical protein
VVAKRLIVHLGLAKTGTTILQQCLHDNRQQLLDEHSILYPAVGPNHFHFQSVVSEAPELLLQIRREGITSRDEAQTRAASFLQSFEEELKATEAETVLISSEYFSSMSQSEIRKLHDLLQSFADEVWAVLYMRDPWSFSQSLMQQFVRDGRFGAPLKYGYCSGQVETIRTCEEIFGKNLVVRPYFGGGSLRTDIIADFCEVIGVPPIPEHHAEDTAANRSMGHLRMTLIAEFNTAWPQYDANSVYVHSKERDTELQWILDLPLKDRPIVLTKRQVDVIQIMAKDDMEYVESRHFGGKRLFSDYMTNETPPERDHTISLSTLTEDDLREIVRATIEAQARGKPKVA